MPKPMIGSRQADGRTDSIMTLHMKPEQKTNTSEKLSQMQLDRLLRKKRSPKYMELMHTLDAGGHVTNKAKVDEIIDAIREEFPEVDIKGILLGYVSTCYLGRPYEVHTLDMSHSIIEHYVTGQPLPNGLEKARSLAMHGVYDFIEVYIDRCICVSSNGDTSVIMS